jgi:hypothetical protein
MAVTPAVTVEVRRRTIWRGRPAGMSSAVDRQRCAPSRVHRSAPKKAAQKVKCCTITAEPGISLEKMPRMRISSTGSRVTATNSAATTPFSTACRRETHEGAALAGASDVS